MNDETTMTRADRDALTAALWTFNRMLNGRTPTTEEVQAARQGLLGICGRDCGRIARAQRFA